MASKTRSSAEFFEDLRTWLRLSSLRPEQVNSLTPAMAHAVNVLWMLATSGRLDRREVKILPTLLKGGDLTLLHAVNYVQSRSLDVFLSESPGLLTEREKFFILSNLFDMIPHEATEDHHEKRLLSTVMEAYAIPRTDFSMFEQVLAIKKTHPVLGHFEGNDLSHTVLTPHMAFAVSMLLTMVVSGKIEPGHADHLQHALHAFPGLQANAVRYVKGCDLDDFLGRAAEVISHEQKLFIFTNIIQLALHNGTLLADKKKLLSQFRQAWDIHDELHHLCFHTLAIKSVQPFCDELRHQLPSRLLEIREKHHTLLKPPKTTPTPAAEDGIHWDREIKQRSAGGEVTQLETYQAQIPKEGLASARRVQAPVAGISDHHEKIAATHRTDANVQLIPEARRSDNRIQISQSTSPAQASTSPQIGGAMLSRWWSAMEDALSRTLALPESLRKSPRIRIPPIIHHKRIVDFSSIGVHLRYENEEPERQMQDPDVPTTEQYSYKLKTCISILRENIELVNQKLNQLAPDQESS